MTMTTAERGPTEQPVNLMPDFWRVYYASRHASTADRVAAFASGFFLPQAGYYSAAGFNGYGTHGRLLDVTVAAWLDRFDRMAASIQTISTRLPIAWKQHRTRFEAAGLHMPANAGECLLPSLFLFDGYSRLWHGRSILFLAPDGIAARLGPEADLAVLLDHEAFPMLRRRP